MLECRAWDKLFPSHAGLGIAASLELVDQGYFMRTTRGWPHGRNGDIIAIAYLNLVKLQPEQEGQRILVYSIGYILGDRDASIPKTCHNRVILKM